jgi:hypothetical protein
VWLGEGLYHLSACITLTSWKGSLQLSTYSLFFFNPYSMTMWNHGQRMNETSLNLELYPLYSRGHPHWTKKVDCSIAPPNGSKASSLPAYVKLPCRWELRRMFRTHAGFQQFGIWDALRDIIKTLLGYIYKVLRTELWITWVTPTCCSWLIDPERVSRWRWDRQSGPAAVWDHTWYTTWPNDSHTASYSVQGETPVVVYIDYTTDT